MRRFAALLLLVAAGRVAGAPRAPDAREDLTASIVVDGLREPTALAFLPDGRLLLLEKAGRVRAWTPESGLGDAPLLAVPSCAASEMSLLGVAMAGERVCLYHTHPPGGVPARCEEGSRPDGATAWCASRCATA